MLTGITLMDYRERYSTRTFFFKRIQKTLIPFVFWSLIAWGYDTVSRGYVCFSPLYVLDGMLNAKFVRIYWFFIPLFAIYLSIPVLSLLPDKRKIFPYAIVYAFVTICVGNVLNDATGEKCMPAGLVTPISAGLLIYPLLGYMLHHSEQTKRLRRCIYLLGIIGFAVHFGVTTYCSPENTVTGVVKGYAKFPSVLQACAAFTFLKYNGERIVSVLRLSSLVNFLRPTIFGIYLIHIYFHFFSRDFMGIDIRNIIYRTLGAVAIFLSAAVVVRLLQCSRIVRIVLPK